MPVRIGQRAKVEQHYHRATGFCGVDQGSSDKGVTQAMRAVRRIGDDVFGQRLVRLQEVLPTGAKATINQIGGGNIVASSCQLAANGSVAAGRFPDIAIKVFNRKQGTGGFRRGWVELERGASGSGCARRARFGKSASSGPGCEGCHVSFGLKDKTPTTRHAPKGGCQNGQTRSGKPLTEPWAWQAWAFLTPTQTERDRQKPATWLVQSSTRHDTTITLFVFLTNPHAGNPRPNR